MHVSIPQTHGLAALASHRPIVLGCRPLCWVLSRLSLVNIRNGFQPDTNADEKKRLVLAGLAWHRAAWPKVLLLSRQQCPCRVTCSKLALGRNGPYYLWDLAVSPWKQQSTEMIFPYSSGGKQISVFC